VEAATAECRSLSVTSAEAAVSPMKELPRIVAGVATFEVDIPPYPSPVPPEEIEHINELHRQIKRGVKTSDHPQERRADFHEYGFLVLR
jgi:hypothetical protein